MSDGPDPETDHAPLLTPGLVLAVWLVVDVLLLLGMLSAGGDLQRAAAR